MPMDDIKFPLAIDTCEINNEMTFRPIADTNLESLKWWAMSKSTHHSSSLDFALLSWFDIKWFLEWQQEKHLEILFALGLYFC